MRFRNNAGFTMIETIVGLSLLAVFALAVITLLGSVDAFTRRARNLTTATQVVQRQMEVYRNTPYSSINVGTDNHQALLDPHPTLLAPRSFEATITETTPGSLKKVELVLVYTDKGKTQTVRTSTYVANRGLNR